MQSERMKVNPEGGRSNVSTHGAGDPVFTMVLAQGATEVVFTVGRNYFSLVFFNFFNFFVSQGAYLLGFHQLTIFIFFEFFCILN